MGTLTPVQEWGGSKSLHMSCVLASAMFLYMFLPDNHGQPFRKCVEEDRDPVSHLGP